MIKYFLLICLLASNISAQELKNYDQIIFCEPLNSHKILSFSIFRSREYTSQFTFVEKLKAKLVFDDYTELSGSKDGPFPINISTNNKVMKLSYGSYFYVKFYGPTKLLHEVESSFTFTGFLMQSRYEQGKRPVELSCISSLSKIQ